MNLVVMRLTWGALVGKKRVLLLLGLPFLLFVIAGLTRWNSGANPGATASMAAEFALGTFVPLMCLLIGTGVIAPEIEDGSIVYLLAKPLPRRTIVLSKLAVAYLAGFALVVLPTIGSIVLAGDEGGHLTAAYGVASSLATIAYVAVFFAISIVSRNAIIVGLLYALLWETILGGTAPGVRAASIRQWALAPAEAVFGSRGEGWGVVSEVGLTTGIVMLILATVASVFFAVSRLKTLRLRTAE